MNRRIALFAGCAAVVLSSAVHSVAGEHPKTTDAKAATKTEAAPAAKAPAAEPMSYTGEVLDLTCYASHPETGSGPAHASCAKTCLDKGLPAGMLIGDLVYLAIMKDHTAPSKALAAYAGQKITVKGTTKEVGGARFLEITQIVPPAPAPAGKS